jgi:hypothetical protein
MEQYLNDNLRAKAKVIHSLPTIRRHTGKVEVYFHSSSALELGGNQWLTLCPGPLTSGKETVTH